MAASYGGPGTPPPAYNPQVWALGYQARQFGVAGPSVLEALAEPSTAMATAAGDPESGGGPDAAEPFPEYEQQ